LDASTPSVFFQKRSVNIDKTHQLHPQKANFASHNTDLIFLILLENQHLYMNLFQRLVAAIKQYDFMRFVKNADRFLKFTGRVFIVLLVVWILGAFKKVYQDESFVFSPFSVPPALVDKGYSGEVLVDKILSDMHAILSRRYHDEQNPEAYRKVLSRPDLNFSAGSRAGYFDFQALFQVGKVLLGKRDKTIKGHLTLDESLVKLYIQMPDDVMIPLSIKENISMDSLTQQAAEFLIRHTTPQYLVYYFLNKQQFSEAEKLLQEIDFQLISNKKNKHYDYERIQWFIGYINYYLAQQDFENAFRKADALREAYPNDLAPYAQLVNVYMSELLHLENNGADSSIVKSLAQKAVDVAAQIEKNDYNSIFLEKKMGLGWVYANWAYMLQKININDARILPKYEKAIEILPTASFAYNNFSYYYLDKKDYAACENVLKKAVLADPKDGNSWDTYAEVMLVKNDLPRFYDCIEKALQNLNPTEGITSELYAVDKRWERVRGEKRFQDLLTKYRK
jgi:tetratricopeptide (TPR) repeat protein